MKIVRLLLISAIGVFTFNSCEKVDVKGDKKTDYDTYYSEDFREAEGAILDIEIADISVLYSHIWVSGDKFSKEQDVSYKLMVKNTAGELSYEEGALNYDDYPNIIFTPQNGSAYQGMYKNDKKTYTVALPGVQERELTFDIK